MRRRRNPREIARRPAGADFAVVSYDDPGGGFAHRKTVCRECPWRLDAPIGAFPSEAYRHSARTAYDMDLHTFACHMVGGSKPTICAGFLLKGADHNLAARLAMVRGEYDPTAVSSPAALYDGYRKMAEANGVDPDDPVLADCR